jgi:proteasome lid subunit RPN8/RPN11
MPSWRMPPLNIPVNVAAWWRKKAVLSVIFLAGILPTPEDNFVLCPEDYAAAEDWGTVTAIVHSHPMRQHSPANWIKRNAT